MIVNKREWLSKTAQEALLYLGEDSTACVAFSHPCRLREGDKLNEPLLAINVDGIVRVDAKQRPSISRTGKEFAHTIVAQVIDLSNSLVQAGTVIIELENSIPGDIGSSDIIEFCCSRLVILDG